MMHVNFNLSVINILYISRMPSSFLNVLQIIICVMLMIKFTVCSITIIFTSLTLTPCNFVVQKGH